MKTRTSSLYSDLLASGVPLASHASDLYAPDSPLVRSILAKWPLEESTATHFTHQAAPHVGERWIDIPFAFLPWWQARAI